MNNKQTGVLLVNLGTPNSATSQGVKAFLKEFLSDKRVVSIPTALWYPLLNGVILPLRSPKVAKLYQSIWMDEGSPLLVYSQRQQAQLESLIDVPVELGMTYGSPSLISGIEQLQERGCQHIVVLPLYPQYSSTTTAAVFDRVAAELKQKMVLPSLSFIRDYYQSPLYILALAQSIRAHWQQHGRADYLLCSYHGIPKRLVDNGDIYAEHCEVTTQLLAAELKLTPKEIGLSYQSRFGKEEWLKPYTSDELVDLPNRGVKRLDIISPAFSVDCLETLEELTVECRDIYQEAGGEEYRYIPCLNDNSEHIIMMAELVQPYIKA
ncbi:ferrochelatase [Aliivibrio kagoshimensis]|uniref:ferrochelatase n=1 Tax=Aliivibrio kagoshimensis TaxID=2910230 RepID=UPI003D0C02DD